jgi:DNA-binding NarL/FixJ family response regulator
MAKKKISIMIVDDHPFFRQGLRRVLEEERDLEVMVEASDGEEALRLARKIVPDVILMDISLPSMNGLEVTRELKRDFPNVAVIMLTGYHDDEQMFHAFKAGAAAYYPKDVSPRKLVKAVREVSRGKYIVCDHVLRKQQVEFWLLKELEKLERVWGEPDELFIPLSPREMEILRLIARGLSNKEIAYKLGISPQTVKNHVTSILRKLGVSDRTQAAVYALRRGWIQLQETR